MNDQKEAGATERAVALVLRERLRQGEEEGRTPEQDDGYVAGELAAAAACYAISGCSWSFQEMNHPRGAAEAIDIQEDRQIANLWPWGQAFFKPKSARRDLVRAAALIVAELERLERAGE